MPRIMITVTKEMDRALKRESERTGAPVAALVRQSIEEWAQKRGIEIRNTVSWGGSRITQDEEEGQELAVAVA